MKRFKLVIGLVLIAFAFGACSPGDGVMEGEGPLPITGEEGTMVVMQNMMFQPQDLEIVAGATVVWVNQDDVPHTVTSGGENNPDGMFDSGMIDPGGMYTFTFTNPGTYEYFCSLHPGMTGIVVVQ
jgi:manganese oxidase